MKDMLFIMLSCGMHDHSGQWAYKVGVQGKKTVSGGAMLAVSRQLSVTIYLT
jgi:glutaminase